MNKLEQAARQALEALEVSTDWDVGAKGKQLQSMKAITALREALAEQAEQEPVAWVDLTKEELHQIEMTCETSAECYRVIAKALKDRNYTRPVRTKDLTDDEIWNDVYDASKHWSGFDDFNVIEFARAVIAADREKNK